MRLSRLGSACSLLAAALLLGACSDSTGAAHKPADSPPAHAGPVHLAPPADTSLTPPGWSPVQVGPIQISVPSGWDVEDPYRTCGQGLSGSVFAFEAPTLGNNTDCRFARNVVAITGATTRRIPHERPVVRNGIRAEVGYRGRVRILRALGMQIRISGPMTDRVLRTLTHSPRSFVLHSRVNSVPKHWRRITFGNLRFAVPESWTVRHRSAWGGCPFNIVPNVLELNRAVRTLVIPCPFPPTAAKPLAAQPGLVVGSGPKVDPPMSGADCRRRAGLRICVDPQPTATRSRDGMELSLLTARITGPGWSHADEIELGLIGSGMTPLRVFDSIEPASR